MSTPPPPPPQEPPGAPHDYHDQEGRTLLAWRRTALSLVAAGALIGHLATRSDGAAAGAAVVLMLIGLGAVVAFTWLVPDRHTAAAGVALVGGVGLLGAVALMAWA